jgi:hypothetical protein
MSGGLAARPLTSSADRDTQSLLTCNSDAVANCSDFKEPSLRAKRSNPSIGVRGANGLLPRSLSSGAHSRDPLARNDVAITEHNSAISRRNPPELFQNHSPKEIEGAGNAGCLLHPRSRVQKCAKNAHEHTGTVGAVRHSPRNGFTAYIALSPATNSSCHRR